MTKTWKTDTLITVDDKEERAVVTMLANGGYVAAWRDADGKSLRFRLYDGDGNPVANGLKTISTANDPQNVRVVSFDLGTGDFAVSWTETGPGTDDEAVKTQVFTVDGVPKSGVRDVRTGITLESTNTPAMVRHGDGYLVVHTVKKGSGQQLEGSLQLVQYNADGAAVGAPIQLTGEHGEHPDIVKIGENRYAVSYKTGDTTVKTCVVDMSTRLVTTAESAGTGGSNTFPDIVAWNGNGNPNGFAVIYHTTNTSGENSNLIIKLFNANGAPTGGSAQQVQYTIPGGINVTDKAQEVVTLRDGRIAVVYSKYSATPAGVDIALRIIDPTAANPIGEEFIVNGSATAANNGWQVSPRISEMYDGRLVVEWYDVNRGALISSIVDARDEKVTVTGTKTNDIYHGTEEDGDILLGNGGNDTLYGGDGNDHFNGGAGADRFVGGDHLGKDNGTEDNVNYAGAKNAQGQLEAVQIYLWDVSKNVGYEAEGDTYVGIEVISGTGLGDILEGDTAKNIFWGDAGDDMLKGFGGDDRLIGGNGSDTMYGGAGRDVFEGNGQDTPTNPDNGWDTVTYEYTNAGVTIDLRNTDNNGGEAKGDTYSGIEAFVGSMGNDVMIGFDDATKVDSFIGKAGSDLMIGGAGNDVLDGDTDNDTLQGGAGNDTLQGGLGSDTLTGGAGLDFVSYGDSGEAVTVTLADDGSGQTAGDTFTEIEGIIGGSGADTLTGNRHSNTLEGGGGADILNGGDGIDFASYAGSAGGVTVSLLGGGTGDAAGDTFTAIEGLIGSAHADSLTGNNDANHLIGGGGSDVLNGGAGNDTLEGGACSDTYYVAAGDRIVEHAGQGTDTVVIAAGFVLADKNDFANIENFILDVSTISSELSGNEDANQLSGNQADNKLFGLGGNDVLSGFGGTDALYGGAGDDVLDGGTGIDAMDGGIGNDIYYVNDLGDQVTEVAGGGIDTVYASVNFALTAGTEVEFLYATGAGALQLKGSNFANTITGNVGANKIYGLSGNDRIVAGSGNDKVYGGLGNDMLYGQAGKDTFVFDTKLNKSTNVDKIYDFKSRDDNFQLDNKYFTKLGSGTASKPKKFNSDMFVEGKKAQDREDRIVYDKKTGALYYDKDGIGGSAQVKIATITNKTKLYYHDFYVI